MKKSLLILGVALALFSCNKETSATAPKHKTAYVDTVKLMEGYEELKDLEDKGKVKSEEMGRELEAKAQQWKMDAASYQNEAKIKGPQWAQLKGQELQKREQELSIMQQSMMKQLQDEFGVKKDTVLSHMRKHIKEYGKKNGFDYIYGTGDAASVLYAKDEYNITDKILKELNATYTGSANSKETPAKDDVAKEDKK
jgi:outer membrane protein